jgi:hypothetical protein
MDGPLKLASNIGLRQGLKGLMLAFRPAEVFPFCRTLDDKTGGHGIRAGAVGVSALQLGSAIHTSMRMGAKMRKNEETSAAVTVDERCAMKMGQGGDPFLRPPRPTCARGMAPPELDYA